MNNIVAKRVKLETVVCALILGCIPFLSAFLYCLLDKGNIGSLFLPDSGWNDELMYFKMTEAVLDRGYPAGFYGFNESHAASFSFAAWSPLLLIQWVLYGIIFGWNLHSPYISNMLAISLSLIIFAFLVKIDKKKTFMTVLLLCSLKPLPRYLLSCIPEPEIFALMIIFAGLCVCCLKKDHSAGLPALWICVFLMTCMRPYMIILFFVPAFIFGMYMKEKGRSKKEVFCFSALITTGIVLVTLVVYYLISKYLTAPYTEELFYTDWITSFKDGGLRYGFSYLIDKFRNSLYAVYVMIREVFSGTAFYAAGLYYFLFIVLTVVLGVNLLINIASAVSRKKKSEPLPSRYRAWLWFEGAFFFAMAAFFVADLLMYRIEPGGRHTLSFVIGLSVLFPFFTSENVYGGGKLLLGIFQIIISVFVLLIFVLKGNIPYEYHLSYADNERFEEMDRLKSELKEKMKLSENVPSFENTVIWTYGPNNTCYSEYFALPTSFGINLVYESIVLEDPENLKSRYIGVAPGSEVEKEIIGRGGEFLAGDRRINFYKLY